MRQPEFVAPEAANQSRRMDSYENRNSCASKKPERGGVLTYFPINAMQSNGLTGFIPSGNSAFLSFWHSFVA